MSVGWWKVAVCLAAAASLAASQAEAKSMSEGAGSGVVAKFAGFQGAQVEPASLADRQLLWDNSPIPEQQYDDPMSLAVSRLNRRPKFENHVTVKTDVVEPERLIQALLKLARDITTGYMESSLPQLGNSEKTSLNRLIHDSYKSVIGSPDSMIGR